MNIKKDKPGREGNEPKVNKSNLFQEGNGEDWNKIRYIALLNLVPEIQSKGRRFLKREQPTSSQPSVQTMAMA